jgi:hypothetical protein
MVDGPQDGRKMILAALALAAGQAAQAPREFIEKVYSSYGEEGFNPLAEPGSISCPSPLRRSKRTVREARSDTSTETRCAIARTSTGF